MQAPPSSPDFTHRSVTLDSDQSYRYEGILTLTKPGNYHFFCAFYIENPTPEEEKLLDINNWNTCVELGEGLTDEDRIEDITVISRELQLARKFAPILFLHPDEVYEPEEVGIMLSCSHIRRIGGDGFLISNPTMDDLYELDSWEDIRADLRTNSYYLDIVGFDPQQMLPTAGEVYEELYNGLAPHFDRVTYAHVREEAGQVAVQ